MCVCVCVCVCVFYTLIYYNFELYSSSVFTHIYLFNLTSGLVANSGRGDYQHVSVHLGRPVSTRPRAPAVHRLARARLHAHLEVPHGLPGRHVPRGHVLLLGVADPVIQADLHSRLHRSLLCHLFLHIMVTYSLSDILCSCAYARR